MMHYADILHSVYVAYTMKNVYQVSISFSPRELLSIKSVEVFFLKKNIALNIILNLLCFSS